MKLLFTLFGSMALLSGCCTTPEEDSAQIIEDEVLEQRISLNILSALDSGDIELARKCAETTMLADAGTLPYYVSKGHLRSGQKEAMITYARKILVYMERHKSELSSRPYQTRPAVLGLQKILIKPEDA